MDPNVIGKRRRRRGSGATDSTWDGCFDGCDGCDGCDLPCDFLIGSTVLAALAIATPRRAARRRTSGPALVGVAAIRAYQKLLSARLPTRCRHTPTCSAYGIDAVRRYGLATGTRLTAGRISRCNRSAAFGTVDPVP